jgi:hypothetical protein
MDFEIYNDIDIPAGWELQVGVEEDSDIDLRHLGTFTDKPKHFAFYRGKWNGREKVLDRNEYRYFEPAENPETVRAWLLKNGYSKNAAYTEAYSQARQAWQRAENHGKTWNQVFIVVKVYVHDVKMAEESLSVEVDWNAAGRKFLEEQKREVAAIAVSTARDALNTFLNKVSK